MGKTIFTILLFISIINVKAQYKEEMLKAIDQLNKAEELDTFRIIANKFEMISMVNSDEWLPFYYASYIHAKMSYYEEEDDVRDALLDKAQKEYDIAKKNNADKDEIDVLQAYIHQARFSVAYMSRLSLNDKVLNILNDVIKDYPDNPRAYLLLGANTYKMPAFIGGGKEKAYKHFKNAEKKFTSFTPKSEIHPIWGEKLNNIWLEKCEEKLKK